MGILTKTELACYSLPMKCKHQEEDEEVETQTIPLGLDKFQLGLEKSINSGVSVS